jgi:branched-chain amino acid transport system permease protein
VKRGGIAERYVVPAASSVALVAVLVAGGLLYASTGGGSRSLLTTDLFITVVIVMGLQIFIGNTGVLSLGHMGFAAIAGYATFILGAPAMAKATYLRNAPWGLRDVEMSVLSATVIAIGLVVLVALFLSPAVNRAPAVTATMMTVAFLFVVHSLIINWNELTNGAGGMQGLQRLQTRSWIYVALVVSVVAARLFKSTRSGRFALATSEDEIASGAAGINLVAPRTWALVVSAAIVGFGASLRTQSLASISPSQFYFSFTLLTLAMLVVGGKRSVTGAILGAVIITVGRRVSLNVAGDSQNLAALPDLFLGGSILLVMTLRPSGLLGDWELDHAVSRVVRRFRPPPAPVAPEPVVRAEVPVTLEARDVAVVFGGFTALDGVTIDARSDEVVGLIGPNGAGKTTLVNVLTGVVPPTRGSVVVAGRDLTGSPPHVIARAGLARTFQNLRLFGDLTVRENVAITALAARRWRGDHDVPDVDALLAAAGLAPFADRKASALDYGSSRKLELARATALAPTFLLLDEPTSGMSDVESAEMIDHVRRTAAIIGAGVLVIDHDLHFITNICDRIHVLDQGRLLASGTPEEIQQDPEVVAAYLGSQGARA